MRMLQLRDDDATGDATFTIWGIQIKIPHVDMPLRHSTHTNTHEWAPGVRVALDKANRIFGARVQRAVHFN